MNCGGAQYHKVHDITNSAYTSFNYGSGQMLNSRRVCSACQLGFALESIAYDYPLSLTDAEISLRCSRRSMVQRGQDNTCNRTNNFAKTLTTQFRHSPREPEAAGPRGVQPLLEVLVYAKVCAPWLKKKKKLTSGLGISHKTLCFLATQCVVYTGRGTGYILADRNNTTRVLETLQVLDDAGRRYWVMGGGQDGREPQF